MSAEQDPASPLTTSNELWLDALSQQAQRCTDEIARRSSTQQAVEAAYYGASAAIAGLFLTGHASPFLLLLVPLLAFVFSRQWLDHHRTIQALGHYVSNWVEVEQERRLGEPLIPGFVLWEGRIRGRKWSRQAPSRDANWRDRDTWFWVLPLFVLFAGISLATLVALIRVVWVDPHSGANHGLGEAGINLWPKLVWSFDLALAALTSWSLIRTLLLQSRKDD